jgi:TPR repeat protein
VSTGSILPSLKPGGVPMSPTNLIANTYNPHNQSPEELIDGFVVRTKEFESVYRTIKTDSMVHPPQHVIIQGRRGSGKTSFLLRVYYEVRRDASVAAWLQPLVFNEELYSVRTLYKLWEHVAAELENEDEDFPNLLDTMQAHTESPEYEEICFDVLIATLQQHKKKLLLLIDNFGDMLRKFSEREQHRLREILITCADIKIIGASSVAMESTYEYDKPFFEFFKIVDLAGLTKQETTTLLLALGDKYDKQQIRKIVEENPGKIEALRRLTDGVPRTMILLFEIFVDNAAGDSFRDLDMVLDRVTPLYKHRMDELSAQQQEIVEIIALQWDAMPVKEIAHKTRMESKAVSAQLRLLEKNRIVIKKQTTTKNHLYQISERFFNIWYLMRCGRRKDKRVQWLTHFLEEWCSGEELVERAGKHLAALKDGVVCEPGAYYMTEALVRTAISPRLQDKIVKEVRSYLKKTGSQWAVQLSESDVELVEKAEAYYNNNKYALAIKILNSVRCQNAFVLCNIGSCYELMKDLINCEKYYKLAIQKGSIEAMFDIALFYQSEIKDIDNAEKFYKIAVENGHVSAMNNLGLLYLNERKDVDGAQKYLKLAIMKGNVDAINNLGTLYVKELEDYENGEKYYLMAVKRGEVYAMYNLALLYDSKKKDFKNAEKYYKMAIEKGDSDAMFNLAFLYQKEQKDFYKAEKYYLMAAEKGDAVAMYNLSLLYEKEKNDAKQSKKYLDMACEGGDIVALLKKVNDSYLHRKNKESALLYVKNAWEQGLEIKFKLYFPLILLWNNDIEQSTSLAKPLFEKQEILEYEYPVKQYLLLLISKKQYSFARRLFNESPLDLRERYRPIYYALMYFMQDIYPDEFKKMGSELEETVMEIVQEIKNMAETM